jgi:hypothetical protein
VIQDKDERAAFRAERAGAAMTKALTPPTWDDLPPGEKQAWLLDRALDRKREILSLPLPDESDDSAEATRLRALVLTAADSKIFRG